MVPDLQQTTEWLDPRVRRTRQMLQQALERLMELKAFEKISVGEIAEDATLNRATFYDHYSDKFALLEDLVLSRFQELLDRRNVVFDGNCPSALMGITLAMCDYLLGLTGTDCPDRRHLEKHFESALMSVARRMILLGLRKTPPHPPLSPELVAAAISGAIYGGVSEWVRTPDRCAAEEVVKSIFMLVHPMMLM